MIWTRRPHEDLEARKLDAEPIPDGGGGGGGSKGGHSDPFFTGREVRIWLMIAGVLVGLGGGVLAFHSFVIAEVTAIGTAAVKHHNDSAAAHPAMLQRAREQHTALRKVAEQLNALSGKIDVLVWRSRSRGLPPRRRNRR